MVGRLDKDTTGLLLLTSDGRIVNAVCRASGAHEKTYEVRTERRVSDEDLERLRKGVVITTTAQSDGNKRELTARTRPCRISRLPLGDTQESKEERDEPEHVLQEAGRWRRQQQYSLRMTLR